MTNFLSTVADGSGVLNTDARRQLLDNHLGASGPGRCPDKERQLIRTLIETSNEPTLEFLLFPTQMPIPAGKSCMMDYLTPKEPENYITIMAILNHPFSRGSCHITSGDFQVLPVWDPRYNREEIDMELLARAAQFTEKLITTEPLKDLLKPNGKRMQIKPDTLEAAKEVVRARQISVFHVCSSAAMLPKEAGGVVDSRLRVYGVKNLRCVDASVFPIEPLGNIQATVYAVAEKAADLLKEDRLKGN